jgi:hypothetical protein
MRVSGRASVAPLYLCLWITYLSSFAIAQSDQVVAERVLGPQWKQLSRRAGMIFAGTVLDSQLPSTQTLTSALAAPGSVPAIRLTFRVDVPIAGVEPGQVLTIREWAGTSSMHRPIRSGQHILLFLYHPSRLGLTSPVGGTLGQIELDGSGKYVSQYVQRLAVPATSGASAILGAPVDTGLASNPGVSVVQLQRAIRSARRE